jgi:preprotein translocase subunit SecY
VTNDLGRRIAFALGALFIYCIGTYIPVPGIDPTALEQLLRRDQPGLVFSMDFGLYSSGHRSTGPR